jgi:chromosome segregation ATPase
MPPIEEQLNNIKVQLKEAFANQLQKIREQLKEVVGTRLEQMTGGFQELSMRVDRLEEELRDLRAENQRLRDQLRQRQQPIREQAPRLREHIRPDAQRRPVPVIRDRIRQLE